MINPLKIKHSGIFLLLLWVIYAAAVFTHFEFMLEMLGTVLLVTIFLSPIIYTLIIAFLLFKDLKKKGHDFIQFEDCVYLFFKLQYRIWQIPTLEKLKSKSDFDEAELNVEYLFKVTANYFQDFDYNRIRIPLLEVEEYLMVHGKLPAPPPQSLSECVVFGLCTNLILIPFGVFVLLFIESFITRYFHLDEDIFITIIVFSPWIVIFYFYLKFIRKRFAELGYKNPTRKHINYISIYLPRAVLHLPKRSDLKNIVDLENENELEMIARTLYTEKIYKRKNLIRRIRSQNHSS